MAEIHAARRRRAREKIAGAGADAALITSGPNVRYLTGLASSNAALLLPADGAAVLATDSRYTLAAERVAAYREAGVTTLGVTPIAPTHEARVALIEQIRALAA